MVRGGRHSGTAAVAGQGVAMQMPAFFAADLAAGRLVQPFDLLATDGDSYWLVYAQERHKVPKPMWITPERRRSHSNPPEEWSSMWLGLRIFGLVRWQLPRDRIIRVEGNRDTEFACSLPTNPARHHHKQRHR